MKQSQLEPAGRLDGFVRLCERPDLELGGHLSRSSGVPRQREPVRSAEDVCQTGEFFVIRCVMCVL